MFKVKLLGYAHCKNIVQSYVIGTTALYNIMLFEDFRAQREKNI